MRSSLTIKVVNGFQPVETEKIKPRLQARRRARPWPAAAPAALGGRERSAAGSARLRRPPAWPRRCRGAWLGFASRPPALLPEAPLKNAAFVAAA